MSASKSDGPDGTINGPPRPSFGEKWLPRLLAAGILGSLAYGARHAMRIPMGQLDTFAGAPLKPTFTGVGPVDELLCRLVSAFSFPLRGGDPAARVQLMYFASLLGASVLTWIVEGYRRDHKTSTFQAAYQIFGIGLVAPIYFLLSILSDKGDIASQSVPPEVGKAILPAFVVGYIIPTVLMFVPIPDNVVAQNIVAFWQPSPIYVAFLTAVIAAFVRRATVNKSYSKPRSRTTPKSKTKSESKAKSKSEPETNGPAAESAVGHLRFAYAFAFVIFSFAHGLTMAYVLSRPELSLYRVFLDLPHPFGEWDLSDPTSAMFVFMKFDMAFYVLAVLVYLLYNIWDLRKLGCISTQEAIQVALKTLAGQLVAGPAATYVGVWSWREQALTKLKA